MKRWEAFDFAKETIAKNQMAALPLEDIQLVRGIIFGRHGRVFKDLTIKAYLNERPWYHANPDFQNSMLNYIERENLDVVRDAEAGKHEFVQPGDMRYWRTRALHKRSWASTAQRNGLFCVRRSKRFTESVLTISRGCSNISKNGPGTNQATVTTRNDFPSSNETTCKRLPRRLQGSASWRCPRGHGVV